MPMQPDLTDDQTLFRDTAVSFIEAELPVSRTRELHDDPRGYDPSWLRKSAELGWFAMMVQEADGGGSVSGAGLLDAAIIAEQMGRFVQPGPFIPMNVAAAAIAAEGSAAQREALLPRIVTGEHVVAWAFADVYGNWDAGAGAQARRDGDDLVLSGARGCVQDAISADALLVAASLDGVPLQLLVPASAPGVTIRPLHALDLSRRFADVEFDAVRVGCDDVLGAGGTGPLDAQLLNAVVLTCADTIGAIDALFTMTVAYAKQRIAFGRPIGSFQAIKHILADQALSLEACKAAAVAAATAVQSAAPDAAEVASMAAAYIGDVACDIAQECLQVYGGTGYAWEHDLHLYLRRVRSNSLLFGEPSWHRERVCAFHDGRERAGDPGRARAGERAVSGSNPATATGPASGSAEAAPAAPPAPADPADPADLAAYRQRARDWLAANLAPREPGAHQRPAHEVPPEELARDLARDRSLRRAMHQAGYVGITLPAEYGGQGLSKGHQQVWNEESARYALPAPGGVAGGVTLSVILPTLLAHASEQQKREWIPRMLSSDEIWVQLLSEPGAGSDLAGIHTKAVRDGDSWVLTGSKIWSSGAMSADYGICLARTDWDVPKHRGLTWFKVPLHDDRVTVRPVREINGGAEFCEEFLGGVTVDDSMVIGDVNGGWPIAATMLAFERRNVSGQRESAGTASSQRQRRLAPDLVELAAARGAAADPVVRQLIARAHINDYVQEQLAARVMAAMMAGTADQAGASLIKLGLGVIAPLRAAAAMEIVGRRGIAWADGEPGEAAALNFLNGRIMSIAGGSNQIQRNIIGERILGLPREPSADSDKPFREVLRDAARWGTKA
jgi:alkylation response protein AidB-like acyl-CoA dehydrogenase